MSDFLIKLNLLIAQDSLFWYCSLAGFGLFILQFIISLFGGASDDFDDAADGHFKWLSKQTLTGFLLMFGLSGLTCRVEFHLSQLSSAIIAFIAGLAAIILTAILFQMAKKLRSKGNVFRIEDAIGKEARVYQLISKGGSGKVTLSLYDLTFELDAISTHDEDLPSFSSVQIIKKADDKTVIVVPTK